MIAILVGLTTFQQGAQPGQTQGSPFGVFLWFGLIIAVFYLLIMRPQSKRQKEHQALVKALQKGDKVVTAGGFHGVIQGVYEEKDIVVVEIADKVRVEVSRGSISKVKKEE